MRVVKVPGVNGLGKTEGVEKAPDILCGALSLNCEGISLDVDNISKQQEQIYEGSLKSLKDGDRVLFIGGDHSITYSLVRGFVNSGENQKCLIVFDAHVDCMPPLREPTHEEFLRALIDEGFDPENVMVIGARDIDTEEKRYVEEKGIRIISVEEIRKNVDIVKKEIEELLEGKEVYVSFDIDVFDSSVVSATGYSVKDGLRLEEGLDLVEFVVSKGIRVGDFVELNPDKPGFEESLRVSLEIINRFKK